MLGDGLRETNAKITASGLNQLFESVRERVLLEKNGLLSDSQKRLANCKLRLDFQRTEYSSHLNGFIYGDRAVRFA